MLLDFPVWTPHGEGGMVMREGVRYELSHHVRPDGSMETCSRVIPNLDLLPSEYLRPIEICYGDDPAIFHLPWPEPSKT